MNKKLIIGLGAVVLVILITLVFTRTGQAPETSTKTEDVAQPNSGANNGSIAGSFKQLMASQENKKCTFSQSSNGFTTNGTTYIAKNKMRTDVESGDKDIKVKSHIVVDGNMSYMWMDGQNQGYKTNLAEIEKMSDHNMPGMQDKSVDMNQSYTFNCEDWSANAAAFVIPTNVQFTDTTQMMNDMMKSMDAVGTQPTGSENPGDIKAMCDKLPEPAKSQCLSGVTR